MTHPDLQSAIGEWWQPGAVVQRAITLNPTQAVASPTARPPTKPVPAEWLSTTPALEDVVVYQRDLWERTVLFWDTLRQRADNMIAHERAGKPPLLDFDYELILDARRFERPVNYALLLITRYSDKCLEDCLDPAKPPVVIVDPRAGHGPGIGGFKRESEVGIAMHEDYPVYFVVFFPEPSPGQTMADVLHTLRRFVEEVSRHHDGEPPVLYGNCQAGWAMAILAADCQGLAGPAVLNGSPLSYWAGESGVNPARVSGGLLGGAWLTHLTSDLADGRFDGAWLVQNFENLKPEGVWEKYASLFSHLDKERERLLDFERWWNGFYFLSREEILAIVENLFIGDKLEQGQLRICPDCVVDLRRIQNPLVIFASYGDNITPPHQALGWIPAVYSGTDDLKRAGQRIVYLINPHAGHLGIFVSASVARLEHRAILDSLKKIEAIPPGLYEMKIDNPTGDPDCGHDAYSVRSRSGASKISSFQRIALRSAGSPSCRRRWMRCVRPHWGNGSRRPRRRYSPNCLNGCIRCASVAMRSRATSILGCEHLRLSPLRSREIAMRSLTPIRSRVTRSTSQPACGRTT